ncbi:hypothetical protein BWI17_18750 [Betaproteobacteria bacterium GR16-43]|nr:hypothetical protein BWI17_18750 [Betaproteobacteria bacterium GR16-43]
MQYCSRAPIPEPITSIQEELQMNNFDIAKLNFSSQAVSAAKADLPAEEARAGVLSLGDWQLELVGGGDSTPNWQDPPTP